MPVSLHIVRLTLVMAAIIPFGVHAQGQSCTDEEGQSAAQTYVAQCLEVSPATRPPCNAENACQLIWDEISRGCAMLGNDRPAFCDDYI